MGAWIEIYSVRKEDKWQIVAPHMGAWIEILLLGFNLTVGYGRTPHGCVD